MEEGELSKTDMVTIVTAQTQCTLDASYGLSLDSLSFSVLFTHINRASISSILYFVVFF